MNVRALLVAIVGLPLLARCSGFAPGQRLAPGRRSKQIVSPDLHLTRSHHRLRASSSNSDNDATSLPSGFNPFNYQRSQTSSGSFQSGDPLRILSLRKNRMQEITNQLLEVATSATASSGTVLAANDEGASNQAMATILKENCEFLLEPLESMDAVLEPDSIYGSSKTRSERYQVYRKQMGDRIANARNPAARRVLQALHDFVLSHE